MQDGRTRKIDAESMDAQLFLEAHEASLTVLSGAAAGVDFPLASPRMIAGRGDGADIRLDFASISSEHAAFEVGEKGFGVRDLGSTNGVRVNGEAVDSRMLEHGDRVHLGDCELQYVVEPRTRAPRTWELDEAS